MRLTNFIKSQINRIILTQKPESLEPVTFTVKSFPDGINPYNNPNRDETEFITFYPVHAFNRGKKRKEWVWGYYEFRGEKTVLTAED